MAMNAPALAVDLQHVSVSVPGVDILHDIHWQVPLGQKVVILGPNGCGKSTLLRAITAYGHVTSGTVDVLGQRLGETYVHDLRKRMGIVDASLAKFLDEDTTAEQLVATGLYGHLTTYFDPPTEPELEQARQVLAIVGLARHAPQLIGTLSAGQLRRTWLARALVHEPELLILDEPTADLDLLARETLLASLSSLSSHRPGLTIMTVTHHLEDLLPTTDQVLLLARGRVVACGTPSDVLRAPLLSEAFGCPVEVNHSNGRWHWSVSPEVWQGLV